MFKVKVRFSGSDEWQDVCVVATEDKANVVIERQRNAEDDGCEYQCTYYGIRAAREEAGLTRAEFVRMFDIPLRTVENWEYGTNEPPLWAEKLILDKLDQLKRDQ